MRLDIEKGMRDGDEIVFKGEGEQNPDYLPGNLIYKLRVQQHRLFRRNGDDLHIDVDLNLKQAILGFRKTVKHLDEHTTLLKREQGEIVQPFEIERLESEGMPRHQYATEFGDLIVKYKVKLPTKLSDKDREILRQIFQK